MNDVNSHGITIKPQEWAQLLQGVTSSGLGRGHQYVVLTENKEKGNKYETGLNKATKLSIQEIQLISEEKIKELKEQYSKEVLTAKKIQEFEKIISDITSATIALIEASEAKMDRPAMRFLRKAARIASFGRATFSKYELQAAAMKKWKEGFSGLPGTAADELRRTKHTQDLGLLQRLESRLRLSEANVSADELLKVKERVPFLIDKLKDFNLNEMEKVENELAQVENKIEQVDSEIKQVESEIEQKESEIKEIESEIKQIQIQSQKPEILSKIAKAEQHIKRLERQRDAAKGEKRSALNVQIKAHEERLAKLKSPEAEKLKQLRGLNASQQKLNQAKEELKGSQQELNQTKEKLKGSQQEFNTTLQKLKSYITEIKKVQNEYKLSFEKASEFTALVEVHSKAKGDVELLMNLGYPFNQIEEILNETGALEHLVKQLKNLQSQIKQSDGKAEKPELDAKYQRAIVQLKAEVDKTQLAQQKHQCNFATARAYMTIELLQELGFSSNAAYNMLRDTSTVPSLLYLVEQLQIEQLQTKIEKPNSAEQQMLMEMTKTTKEQINAFHPYIQEIESAEKQYNLSFFSASKLIEAQQKFLYELDQINTPEYKKVITPVIEGTILDNMEHPKLLDLLNRMGELHKKFRESKSDHVTKEQIQEISQYKKQLESLRKEREDKKASIDEDVWRPISNVIKDLDEAWEEARAQVTPPSDFPDTRWSSEQVQQYQKMVDAEAAKIWLTKQASVEDQASAEEALNRIIDPAKKKFEGALLLIKDPIERNITRALNSIPTLVDQFRRDYERDITFIRKDTYLELHDETAVPFTPKLLDRQEFISLLKEKGKFEEIVTAVNNKKEPEEIISLILKQLFLTIKDQEKVKKIVSALNDKRVFEKAVSEILTTLAEIKDQEILKTTSPLMVEQIISQMFDIITPTVKAERVAEAVQAIGDIVTENPRQKRTGTQIKLLERGEEKVDPNLIKLRRQEEPALNQRVAKNAVWSSIMQSAVTQASGNAGFGQIIGKLTGFLTDQVSWPGKVYLRLDPHPGAINVEVIRNPKTHLIEKLQVRLETSIDLTKKQEDAKKDANAEVMIPKALEASITYTVNLDKEGWPFLSDVTLAGKTPFKRIIDPKLLDLQ